MQPGLDRDGPSAGTGDSMRAFNVLNASEVFQASANLCTASRSLKSALVILEGERQWDRGEGVMVLITCILTRTTVKQYAYLLGTVNDRSVSFPRFFLNFGQHSWPMNIFFTLNKNRKQQKRVYIVRFKNKLTKGNRRRKSLHFFHASSFRWAGCTLNIYPPPGGSQPG